MMSKDIKFYILNMWYIICLLYLNKVAKNRLIKCEKNYKQVLDMTFLYVKLKSLIFWLLKKSAA